MEREDRQIADDEALQWFVILRDEDATDKDSQLFEEWRRASPEHDRAWREVERVWGKLDILSDKYGPASMPSLLKERHYMERSSTRFFASRFASWKGTGLALCLLLAVAIGWQMTPVGLMADYRSSVGERQTIRLEDGSEIELATGSAIDVDFTADRRIVSLVTGEAFFTIAKNPQRPFIVQTQDGRVEVLGTAFNVRIRDNVTVAVMHNTVQVSTTNGPAVRVTEGQMVHFDIDGVSPVENADLDTVQAWRHDQLVFNDTPLNQVIKELQRYHRGHIQLLSNDVGRLRITAVFDTIAESLDLKVFKATSMLVGIAKK